jgi:hypothetical protein
MENNMLMNYVFILRRLNSLTTIAKVKQHLQRSVIEKFYYIEHEGALEDTLRRLSRLYLQSVTTNPQ